MKISLFTYSLFLIFLNWNKNNIPLNFTQNYKDELFERKNGLALLMLKVK
jgi:hypothetical protein